DLEIAGGSLPNPAHGIGERLLGAMRSLVQSDDVVQLRCAEARFPVSDGRLAAPLGLGFATAAVDALGGGTISLADGTLDVDVAVRPRAGSAPDAAARMHVGGTLRAPVVGAADGVAAAAVAALDHASGRDACALVRAGGAAR